MAAGLVFFFHAVPEAPADAPAAWLHWPVRVAQQGYIGVSIFFVLSGFLIANRNFDRVELTGSWLRRYWQNRVARIYPLYFLLTVFGFAVMLVHPIYTWYEWPRSASGHDKVVAILLNLALMRAYFHDFVFVGVPTAWTLTIEETFYLLAPLLLLGLRRSVGWLCIYAPVLVAIGALLVLACTRWLPYYGLMADLRMMLSDTFFGRCAEFLVGMGLAWWVRKYPAGAEVHNGTTATILGGAGILGCVLLLMVLERTLVIDSPVSFYANKLVNNLVLPIPIAVLLWGLMQERTWLRRALESGASQLLGKSSYAFYLIHLGAVDTIFAVYVSGNVAVRLGAYVVLSILLYKWVEHPLQKRLRAPTGKPVLVASA